jgi:hypothetical protein
MDEADEMDEDDEMDESSESGRSDESGEMDESGESGESDASEGDGNDKSDENNDSDGSNESDEPDEDTEIDETFDGHESDDSNDSSEEGDSSEDIETFFVLVGTGQQQSCFEVDHDHIMTKRSKFFRAAMSGSERCTSETRRTDLPQHDAAIFHFYLEVLEEESSVRDLLYPEAAELYEKKMPGERTEADKKQYRTVIETFRQDRYTELVKLYILADYLEDPLTATMVVDEIQLFMGKHVCTPSTKVINLVLDATDEDDGLRLVFADFFVYHIGPRLDPELPKEFFVLVAEGYELMKADQKIVVKKECVEEFGRAVRSDHWDWETPEETSS